MTEGRDRDSRTGGSTGEADPNEGSGGQRPADRSVPTATASRSTLDRRALLRLGSAGVAAALAGCWGQGDEREDEEMDEETDADEDDEGQGGERGGDEEGGIPYAPEYGTVVDLVADAGADPHAEESIVPILDDVAGDDTLVYLPQGQYLMHDLWTFLEFEHLGIVGEDATIVPPRDYFGYLFVFGVPDRPARDLLFEGIDFDFTAPDTAPRPIQVQIDDGFVVRDVAAHGVGGTARFDVTTQGGSGLVENLDLSDGGMEPNPVGVLVGPANHGRIRFAECTVEGFPGNGLYASPSAGPIEVVGGEYANNGIASVRVSSPAVVRDVTVRCDEAPAGFRNMRGIRLRHGESVLVENCTVELRDLTYSDGAIVVEPMMSSATVRDVDVEVSVDEVPALHVKTPRHEQSDADIDVQRMSVTGDAARGSTVEISDRQDCALADVDIQQSGRQRNGIHLIRTTDSVLRNSEIDVTGDPLILEQSRIRRTNNRL